MGMLRDADAHARLTKRADDRDDITQFIMINGSTSEHKSAHVSAHWPESLCETGRVASCICGSCGGVLLFNCDCVHLHHALNAKFHEFQ
jgi:hypothetical protein